MNPFEDLSTDNHDQIRKYLRFFRQKKDGIMRDIDSEFTDVKDDRLDETMFTRDDMIEYSDFVASAIKVRRAYVELIRFVVTIAYYCFCTSSESCKCRHCINHQYGCIGCQPAVGQLTRQRSGADP